jgi:choline dehydrogenase
MALLTSIIAVLALCAIAVTSTSIDNQTYEYIVVGSGPGGSPLASNLARAGHSVLLLEAGDDQTENLNVSNWLNFNLAGNDPATVSENEIEN